MNTRQLSIYFILGLFLLITACGGNKAAIQTFGQAVDSTKAIAVNELAGKMGSQASMDATVSGQVSAVCKAEGCWLKLAMENEKTMMVRMKDHSFTVPDNIEKKFAFIAGQAHYDTTSVEKLRHYAEDEGQSDSAIALITQPEVSLVFEATGVILR